MTGPGDYRGTPPGAAWGPPGPDRTAAPAPATPASWAPPTTGQGWSAGPGAPAPSGGVGGPGMAGAPRRSLAELGAAKLFGLAIAALGALNFVFGFLPQVTASRIDESLSVYSVGPGYVPILLLIAGLLALAAFLPGSERSRLAVAAVSVGGAVGALISLGTTGPVEMLTTAQVSKGLGAVLLTIFGIIQAVVAIAAYVVGSDLGSRTPRPAPPGTMTPGTMPPGSGMPDQAGYSRAAPGGPVPPHEPTWTAEGPARFTPWSPPGPTPAPAGPGYPGAYPTGSGWAPPADDDRPTGPQPVVGDHTGSAATPPPGPAERELPRVAPVTLDKGPEPDPSAGPTEVYRVPPRPDSARPDSVRSDSVRPDSAGPGEPDRR